MPVVEISEKIFEELPLGWAWLKSGKRLERPNYLYVISEHLYKVAKGEIKRLMIWAPPRHFKSETVTVWFPAYILDHFPDKYIIEVSHGGDLATEFGRKVRDIVDEHGRYKVREDSSAAGRWNVVGHKGGMYSVGFGGSITGRGADIMIVDDPVKNFEEVMSHTQRDKKWEYYRSTLYNRQEPNCAIVVVMQRWHKDDLCGRILEHAKSTGEQWTILKFPAFAEENDILGRAIGEPLYPERYDKEALEQIKGVLGYWFYAQYQQRPLPPEDQTVNPEWWKRIDEKQAGAVDVMPEIISACRYWDMAAKKETATKRGDYAAGVLTVKDVNLRYGISDIRRVRRTAAGIEDEMVASIIADYAFLKAIALAKLNEEFKKQQDWQERFEKGYHGWFIANYKFWFESDTGGTGEIAAAYLTRAIREKAKLNIPIQYEHPSGSKQIRANPMIAQAMAGNYWIWGIQTQQGFKSTVGQWDIAGFQGRMGMFPNGDYDDEIDGASGGFSKLLNKQSGNFKNSIEWI